jgi:NAD(P)-dependent dehydrogenase (short-subunit alcohol dehydrogenase family)
VVVQPAIQEDVIAAIDLADASTLVVGATGGLGSRIARRLVDRGAALTLVGRTQARVDDLDVPGPRLALDLRLPSNVARAVDAAVDAHGRLDVVVNAAAWSRSVPSPTCPATRSRNCSC